MLTGAMTRKPVFAAGLIFCAVAALMLAFYANRLIFSPDEGIILNAAQQMLGGKTLYVDFFGYMSPGSYWLQEFVFRWLGLSLRTGRVVVILDFALQCSLVFWLLAAAGHRSAGWAAATLFFCLEAGNPGLILPGHRWDSAALSLLSIALCIHGAQVARRLPWIAAGALAAFAAFCTPSIAVLGVITVIAIWISGRRAALLPYLGAAAVTAGCLFAVMWTGGYLSAFAQQMRWLAGNYSRVNVTPYGWPLGGYAALFQAVRAAPMILQPLLLISALGPALLPVLAGIGWACAWVWGRWSGIVPTARFSIAFLLACLAGYVVSAEPRPDITHLTTVSPVAYVLVAILICTYVPAPRAALIFTVLLPLALVSVLQSAMSLMTAGSMPTPAGRLRVASEEEPELRSLLAAVRPRQSLYVHPYLPLFYFLTQTNNPTRYSYLAPGMMGPEEERTALQELEKCPPDWVLYLPLQEKDYLRVFPSAAGLNLHYETIERWIQGNYAPLTRPLSISGYQLMARRRPVESASASLP